LPSSIKFIRSIFRQTSDSGKFKLTWRRISQVSNIEFFLTKEVWACLFPSIFLTQYCLALRMKHYIATWTNILDKPSSLLFVSLHRAADTTEKIVRELDNYWKLNKQIFAKLKMYLWKLLRVIIFPFILYELHNDFWATLDCL
jgi:hypothetical protein